MVFCPVWGWNSCTVLFVQKCTLRILLQLWCRFAELCSLRYLWEDLYCRGSDGFSLGLVFAHIDRQGDLSCGNFSCLNIACTIQTS